MRAGDRRAARTAFERALQLDPASREALIGITTIDVLQKDVAAARARVEARLALQPDDPELLLLAAKAGVADGDHGRAEALLRRAIELDPTFAPAWTGVADAAYGMSSIFIAPDVAIPQARAAAEKALALDPDLPEAHTSLGIVKLVFEWDWDGARRELLPNLNAGQTVEAFSCALHYADAFDRNEEALGIIRRSLDRPAARRACRRPAGHAGGP